MRGEGDGRILQCCEHPLAIKYRETSDGDIIEFWVECDTCGIEGFRNPLLWEAIKEWNDMVHQCDIFYNEGRE